MEDDRVAKKKKQVIDRPSSRTRMAEIIFKLLSGDVINKQDLLDEYKIGYKATTIDYRVIKDAIEKIGSPYRLDSKGSNHYFTSEGSIDFDKALAIVKVVIGSQAFSKEEVSDIIDIFSDLIPTEKRQAFKRLLAITVANYSSRITEPILNNFKVLSQSINDNKSIRFTYNSSVPTTDHTKEREGRPLSLYFVNKHFYTLVYLPEKDDTYTYRIDRFIVIRKIRRHIEVPQVSRPDEGKLLKNTFLLNGGNYIHYKFSYEAPKHVALDNVPNSHLSKDDDPNESNLTIVEGDLYSQGAALWVMSQGPKVQVLEPESLKKEVKDTLQKTLRIYED